MFEDKKKMADLVAQNTELMLDRDGLSTRLKDTTRSYENKITDLENGKRLEIAELKHSHKLELAQKEFDIKHYKDDELQAAQKELGEVRQQMAVLKKENEMLDRITDVNKDVLDVKELVNKLIEKLPEVKINTLAVSSSNKAE